MQPGTRRIATGVVIAHFAGAAICAWLAGSSERASTALLAALPGGMHHLAGWPGKADRSTSASTRGSFIAPDLPIAQPQTIGRDSSAIVAAGSTLRPSSPGNDQRRSARRRELFIVTAYCPCRKCCGRWAGDGKTASGLPITTNRGHFVAADTRVLPFGTRVRVPGYAGGRPVPVIDRGGRVRGKHIDVFFTSHARAKRWGKKRLWIEIVGSPPSRARSDTAAQLASRP